ncbi:hypothetical protein ACFV9E_17870 [Streptomyces sp. NPDC059835]|uniref:hypothetical protein n=1 Tax=Streptomyces sp. NPDC059835 TaxID=3346967 RepID=UPI00365D8736
MGTIGLIKAIDRYDPEREVESSTLASAAACPIRRRGAAAPRQTASLCGCA